MGWEQKKSSQNRLTAQERILLNGLQTEVAFCVVVADAFYDLFERCFIIRIFTVFDPFADLVAEDAAEVFVTGIA